MNDNIPRTVNAMNAVIIKQNRSNDLVNEFQQVSSKMNSGANSTKNASRSSADPFSKKISKKKEIEIK